MLNLYPGMIAPCPECDDEAGVCEHRWENQTCEHGMSAWLCMGPQHYPSRQDEMEGRYF